MPVPPSIDLQAIEILRALNPGDQDEFLREIACLYLDDTPQRIAELDRSLAADDAAGFIRAAHSIKGSSANLGAQAVRVTAEKLEDQSRASGLIGVASLVAQLKSEYAQAAAELSRLVGR